MKHLLFSLFLFLFVCQIHSQDTVFIRETKTPILIDREDNVLFYIRINGKQGDIFDRLIIQIDDNNKLSEIKSIKLYYAGTEAPERKNTAFSPVRYIPAEKANPSYSVLQDKKALGKGIVELNSQQILFPGINYFWVSVEMKSKTSLLSLLNIKITEAIINNEPAYLSGNTNGTYSHKMGYGVRYPGNDNSAAYRIPGLVTSNKGTLLGVYDVRYNSAVDLQEHVDIGLSRSTTKGQTWEKMRIIMNMKEYGGLPEAQNGIGDPAILVDEHTGTIWVIAVWTHGMGNGRSWFNSRPGMLPKETPQLMLVKSKDDGKTWSEPINITSQVKDPSWNFLLQGPGRGITMADGTLVFPIQFIDKDRMPYAGIMYSKDHGENWHIHNPARSNTTEAQVAESEPGILMLNMRDNRGGSRAISITKDLGKTWEEHPTSRKALQEPVCMASILKIDAKDNILNKKIILFSNPNTTSGRHNITIKASLDEGMSWPENYQLLLDDEPGWGYSCLTMIDNETVGILYESSQTHMTFQAIKLKEIIKQ